MMTNEQVLEKMEEDFLLRGSSEKTRQTYRTALIRFSAFAGKDRYSDLDEKDLRSFLLHLHQEDKLQGSSIKTYNAGCRFFLEVVLSLAINRRQVPMPFSVTSRLKMKTIKSETLVSSSIASFYLALQS